MFSVISLFTLSTNILNVKQIPVKIEENIQIQRTPNCAQEPAAGPQKIVFTVRRYHPLKCIL